MSHQPPWTSHFGICKTSDGFLPIKFLTFVLLQVADSYGTEFLSDMSTYNTPGDGVHQTTGGYHVSGRELGTSHLQSNNQQHLDNNIMASSTSHHMAWPTFQTTYNDKYSPPPFASIDSDCPRQQAMPAIFGDPSSTNYLGMHHGLPSNDWAIDPNMPILEESMLCNGQVSPPDTAYSSFSSTSASEAMASMSLDTPIGTSSISSSDMIMACPSTISPKVLRINPSPAPTCSSDSTHTTFLPGGDGNISSASSFEQQYIPPVTSKRLNAKGRKVLPDRPRTPLLLSFQTEASSSRRSWDKHAASHRSKHLADLRPKPRISLPESPTTKDPETMERNKQNEFLIQSKQAGMTYRDIKREGGFKEAESTLRGRYRTLTKPKLARVRKPEWSDRDVSGYQAASLFSDRSLTSVLIDRPPKKSRSQVDEGRRSHLDQDSMEAGLCIHRKEWRLV